MPNVEVKTTLRLYVIMITDETMTWAKNRDKILAGLIHVLSQAKLPWTEAVGHAKKLCVSTLKSIL